MPKISVIVPVYKVEVYLSSCIDSILAQTFADFELILVDDGSPDKCGEICDRYSQKDSRIKVIHKKNGGLSDARNAGLEIARGDCIMFVDSDDYIAETMLERMYVLLCAQDADMVACSVCPTDERGETLNEASFAWLQIGDGTYIGDDCLFLLNDGAVMAWAKLYKKELFATLRFPVGKLHEDEFLAHHLAGACKKIVKIDEPLYYYRQRCGSIMNTNYSRRNLDGIEAYLDRMAYCMCRKMPTLAIRTASIVIYTFKHAKRRLDFSDKATKKRFQQLHKQFSALYVTKVQREASLKTNLSIWLYLLFPGLHDLALERRGKLFAPLRFLVRKMRSRKFEKGFRVLVREKRKHGMCVFLMATPCHGNLGDHAIVYAQKKMLEQCGHYDTIIEISNDLYHKYKHSISKYVKDTDIVVIDGGGNLGTLWPLEDDKISEIIDTYKDNKIVVFPQTCYYDDGKGAQKRLEKNQKVYASAKQLLIALRDKKSFDFCKENFPGVQFVYTPDVVLSLEEGKKVTVDDKCLLCFRSDCEKVLTKEEEAEIISFLQQKNIAIETVSTVCDYAVGAQERERELFSLWKNIGSARLLLTDRLHGMIFAAITGTPCLALDNKSKKVSGVSAWISKLPYINVCETLEQMLGQLETYYAMREQSYDANALKADFAPLREFLQK